MPGSWALYPEAWVIIARYLAQEMSQTALRRAISTAYFAMFHAVLETAADSFIIMAESPFSEFSRQQILRGLGHGQIRKACKHAALKQFSPQIQNFAKLLVEMQGKRQAADYNPSARFIASDVLSDIDNVEKAIKSLASVSPEELQAFAALILFKTHTP